MGSDNGPEELIKGAVKASKKCGAEILYVGQADLIRSISSKNNFEIPENNIFDAREIITMDSDPFEIRSLKNSSMRVALEMLSRGEGDALVSCGNTGALHTGATLYVRRIRGIHRAAISAVLPMQTPLLLLDAGANLTVTPDNEDVATFEYETKLKVLAAIPPVDERQTRIDPIVKFISKMGL